MVRYGYVVDLERCMGCRACVEACKVENNTPTGVFWMWVFRTEEGEYPNVDIKYLPRPCMHCDNPPCVKVCPVDARFKDEKGFVSTDWDRCIGCRYCVIACPYGVNYFNWKRPETNYYYDWFNEGKAVFEKVAQAIPPYKNPNLEQRYGSANRPVAGGGHRIGVVEKCTWCVHRVENGLKKGLKPGVDPEATPACVVNCPVKVFSFGDLDDPDSEASKILAKKKREAFRLLEEFGTEPKVYYIGTPPSKGVLKKNIVIDEVAVE